MVVGRLAKRKLEKFWKKFLKILGVFFGVRKKGAFRFKKNPSYVHNIAQIVNFIIFFHFSGEFRQKLKFACTKIKVQNWKKLGKKLRFL